MRRRSAFNRSRQFGTFVVGAAIVFNTAWATSPEGTPSGLDARVSRTTDDKQAALMNQLFGGTFSSTIPDGAFVGQLDAESVLFVPALNKSGYLVRVPAKNDFDDVRISILVRRKDILVGEIRSGIVYWRSGRCVVGFGGMETPDRRTVPVRGYIDLAALSGSGSGHAAVPGDRVLLTPKGSFSFPVVVDHSVEPPSDDEDED
jgi:hypothetical protein